jgi:hypothetical protein
MPGQFENCPLPKADSAQPSISAASVLPMIIEVFGKIISMPLSDMRGLKVY